MEQVLEIIQAAIPRDDNNDSGDIEIPLDALDTFTLRKLQKFIEDNAPKKKPPSSGGSMVATAPLLQRQSSSSSTKGDPTAKKPRKSNVGTPKGQHAGGAPLLSGGGHNDLSLFDHDNEELLFSTDCFDELRGGSQQSAGVPEHQQAANGHSSGDVFSFDQQQHASENSNEGFMRGGRPRAGSLDEDFEDLLDIKSPGNGNADITVHNPEAWQMSSAAANGGNGDASEPRSSLWESAAQEMQAKRAKEEENRLF